MANDVSAPLPDLTLERKSILTVDTGDANASITQLVIHFAQDVPDLPVKLEPFTPLFAYGPPSGNEAPGVTP